MHKATLLKYLAAFFLVFSLSVPLVSLATVGVGVGSGKITVQKPLAPGGIYTLPSVPVFNTGDEASHYSMDIEYLQDQPQQQPPQDWFSFSPGTFALDPGKAQTVGITISVPIKAKPGDYFAYVEAHPVIIKTAGVSRVNIAAASKLYFTVAPSNIFEGMYYRVVSFVTHYAPWTYIAAGVLLLAILGFLIFKFFRFNIGISIKKK